MDTTQAFPMRLFDAAADTLVVQRRLPHWAQAGTVCFITWRTYDSMKAILDGWFEDRGRWLRAHGIDPEKADWRDRVLGLDNRIARDFLDAFWNRWHDALDQCKGGLRSTDYSSGAEGFGSRMLSIISYEARNNSAICDRTLRQTQ
jgi:hypothetical protein